MPCSNTSALTHGLSPTHGQEPRRRPRPCSQNHGPYPSVEWTAGEPDGTPQCYAPRRSTPLTTTEPEAGDQVDHRDVPSRNAIQVDLLLRGVGKCFPRVPRQLPGEQLHILWGDPQQPEGPRNVLLRKEDRQARASTFSPQDAFSNLRVRRLKGRRVKELIRPVVDGPLVMYHSHLIRH